MKTVEIKLYSFDELSKEAQAVAIEKQRENVDIHCDNDDYSKSLELFAAEFGLKSDYTISAHYHSKVVIFTNALEHDIYDLYGVRALAYINNKTSLLDSKLKTYNLANGKKRKSKIVKYPYTYSGLTGYHSDFVLIEQLIESIKNGECLGTALNQSADKLCEIWQADLESKLKDEYLIEEIQALEIDYLESGKRFYI